MTSISKSSKQQFYFRQLDYGNFFLFHRSILVQTKTRMHSELHDTTRTRRFDLHKRSRLRNLTLASHGILCRSLNILLLHDEQFPDELLLLCETTKVLSSQSQDVDSHDVTCVVRRSSIRDNNYSRQSYCRNHISSDPS